MTQFVCGIVLFMICAAVGAVVSDHKGRGQLPGLLLGLLLGPIGLIIVAVLPPDQARVEADQIRHGERKRCRECGNVIMPQARVCQYCGAEQPQRRTA